MEDSNSFHFVAIPILYKIECFFGFDSWNFFLFNQFDLDRNWKIGIILSACEDYQFQYRVLEDLVKGNKDKRKIKMHFTHKFPYRARNSTKKQVSISYLHRKLFLKKFIGANTSLIFFYSALSTIKKYISKFLIQFIWIFERLNKKEKMDG